MAAMQLPAAVARWLSGWAELARRDAVPGYAVRGRLARLGLDIAALGAALTCGGTGFAALVALATGLGGLVLAWELDLAGWQRDALLCLPVVLVAPWVAAGARGEVGTEDVGAGGSIPVSCWRCSSVSRRAASPTARMNASRCSPCFRATSCTFCSIATASG